MCTRRILATILPLPKLRIACLMMNISGCLRNEFDCMSFKARTTVYGSLSICDGWPHKVEAAKGLMTTIQAVYTVSRCIRVHS